MRPLLELRGIGKSFTGTRALDGVNLQVRSGEVVALLGENGAGKSTLMKILSGVWPQGSYDGEIWMEPPLDQSGIAMIHQELSVFPELTVGEHLELDRLPVWIDWTALHRRSQEFLDRLGFGLKSQTRVGDLSVGGRQLVEIARALHRNAQVLVFDEPTSALTEPEVQKLYTIIDRLRSEGRGIIYITHRLDEIFRLADRMVVLRDGKNAGEASRGPRAELEPKLISWMVGREVKDIYPPRNDLSKMPDRQDSGDLLKVENLSVTSPTGKKLLQGLSFTLKRGEVLGLAGLLGAGRSETFEALFGALSDQGPRGAGYKKRGNAWIRGKRKELNIPGDAIAARMAYVSEDRKGSGLVLGQSILDNIMLPSLVSGAHARADRDSAGKWTKELKLKFANLDQAVGELSGGNQQKVVLAKWLMTDPEILFLDEPTRGIDVGAKVEIYAWIQRLASQGMGIVVASSEMPELLGVCHKILVLREGQQSAEFSGETATQEDIMRAASL